MSQVIVEHETRVEILQIRPKGLTLFDALYNSLVLRNTLPYLPVSGLLNLAATCRDLRYLIYQTPGVFRHVDLTRVKTAHFGTTNTEAERSLSVWRNVQLSEYLTEDDFYAGPLRGIFSTLKQRDILRDVQSLILDGLSVTAELCHEIINDPTYSVRMLSIRDVKNLNHGKLRAALAYACRSSRPEGAPRLKALYIFGSKDAATPLLRDADTTKMSGWNHKSHKALTASLEGEADAWWSRKGRMLSNGIDADWAQCLLACQGLISFDAVLCQGPRHRNSAAFGKMRYACNAAIATFAVGGCASCGKAPEGLMNTEITHPSALPLLSPPPILSSSVQAATTPRPGHQDFAARCADCLRDRFCVTCNKWWCETCYEPFGHGGIGMHEPSVTIVEYDGSWNSLDQAEPAPTTMTKAKARVSRSCWECGMNCDDCIERTQKICKKCCGGYCLTHNEGSSSSFCDWCFSRGRGLTRV
ncbi:hypothetical protein ACHAPT_011840 [Fusarium lateritium]